MNIQDLKLISHEIKLTPSAKAQLELMKINDFTLKNMHLRINIQGKGCDGFTYAISFDEPKIDDVKVSLKSKVPLDVLLDPFTAKFVRTGTLDFTQSHFAEGFMFYNDQESLYKGKFFKSLEFENI